MAAQTIDSRPPQDPTKFPEKGVKVVRAVTVNRPIHDLYLFWRDFTNLPRVMHYVESVQPIGENRSHWVIQLPNGSKSEFDTELYTDVVDEVISWRSLEGSELQNAGAVRFRPAPADRGTQVELTVEFIPPGGIIGEALMKLFNDAPSQYIGQYLREFKSIMETGETPTIQGQSSGRKEDQTK